MATRPIRAGACVAAVVAILPVPLAAAPTQTKLDATGVAARDLFGFAVALDGDTALVGAQGDDDRGDFTGRAYVFVRSGGAWTEQQALSAPDAAAADVFGYSVSLDRDTALVGGDNNDDAGTDSGSAYVFVRSGTAWSVQQKLTAADATAGDHFGWSVAVDGDVAVVGTPYESDTVLNVGAVYVFVRNGTSWTQQQKLKASDGALGDVFGWSVAVSGDTVVAGAPGRDDAGDKSGAAYVFKRTGSVWQQQMRLNACDASSQDGFGWHVAVDSDTLVVGAPGDDERGSAHVFARSGSSWAGQQRLSLFGASRGDAFGGAVTVSGDRIVVGATEYDTSGTGAAHVFLRSGTRWSHQERLAAADGAADARFGNSVAASGDFVLVGMSESNRAAVGAYVFDGIAAVAPPPVSFVAPARVDVRVDTATPSRSSVTASGFLDVGPAAIAAGEIRVELGCSTRSVVLAPIAHGRKLRYTDGATDLRVVPPATGTSRAAFSLRVTGDLAGKVSAVGPLDLRFSTPWLDSTCRVVLSDGSFAISPRRGSFASPGLVPVKAKATVKGGGKDGVALVLAAPTAALPTGPQPVTLAFNAFGVTIAAAEFKGPVKGRLTARKPPSAPGVSLVVIDTVRGTVTLKARGVDLGAFGAGVSVPVRVSVNFGSGALAADVRLGRRGTTLTY